MQRDMKAFRRDRLSGQAEFTKQMLAKPDDLLRIFRRRHQREKQEIQFRKIGSNPGSRRKLL